MMTSRPAVDANGDGELAPAMVKINPGPALKSIEFEPLRLFALLTFSRNDGHASIIGAIRVCEFLRMSSSVGLKIIIGHGKQSM